MTAQPVCLPARQVFPRLLALLLLASLLLGSPQPAVRADDSLPPNLVSEWGLPSLEHGYFTAPNRLAVDRAGNVYVADQTQMRIQKFDRQGRFLLDWVIPPPEEDLNPGWTGILLAANPAGEIMVHATTPSTARLLRYSSTGRPVPFSYFPEDPWRINNLAAGPSGNFYIVQSRIGEPPVAEFVVQVVTPTGKPVRRWQGKPFCDHFNPGDITVGPDETVYVISTGCGPQVEKYTASGAFLDAWPVSGYEERLYLSQLAVAPDGSVYVFDQNLEHLIHLDSRGRRLSVTGGFGGAPGQFDVPEDMLVTPSGLVLVADTGNKRVQVLDSQGSFLRTLGSVCYSCPVRTGAMASGSDGLLYVLDQRGSRVMVFDSRGSWLRSFGSYGADPGQFRFTNNNSETADMSLSPQGRLYVLDTGNSRIQIFSTTGELLNVMDSHSGASVSSLNTHVAVAGPEEIYLTNRLNPTIARLNSGGKIALTFGSKGSGPGQFGSLVDDLAAAPGLVYALDTGAREVKKFTGDGVFLLEWVVPPGPGYNTYTPTGLALAPDGSVYVTSREYIHKFTSEGVLLHSWTVPGPYLDVDTPHLQMTQDPFGNFYAADPNYQRIWKYAYPPTGITLTRAIIPPNLPAGAYVGELITGDPRSSDPHVYTLVEGEGSADNALFAVQGSKLVTASSFSPGDQQYSIRLRSTDPWGGWVEQPFTLTVAPYLELFIPSVP